MSPKRSRSPHLVQEEVVALSVALDTAALQAGIDAESNISRDVLAEAFNVLAVQAGDAAEGRADNSWVETEEGLSDLLDAGILVVEPGDEDSILTVWVELLVDSALREDGHLVERERVGDWRDPVLNDELSHKPATHNDVELGCPIMNVCCIHTAWAQKP